MDIDPATTDYRRDSFDEQIPTSDALRWARWIVGPRATFTPPGDLIRHSRQYRRLHILLDGRPAGDPLAEETRLLCTCGDVGAWHRDPAALAREALLHTLRHRLQQAD